MKCIYSVIIAFVNILLKFLSLINFIFSPGSKFGKFVMGQRFVFSEIEKDLENLRKSKNRIWIHAASLGEYGVARPIIKRLKQEQECTIILTFFSSTGYEVLKNKPADADFVFYLPLDTRRNARKFLKLINPKQAIFIISEFWINYLSELKKREIPTYIISAIINKKSAFFKWYGPMFTKSLAAFTRFFVLDKNSKEHLAELGYSNADVTGDPLFDNVMAITETPYKNPVIERFANGEKLFIVGSISDINDIRLAADLANSNSDTRFIFVPHEINEEFMQAMCKDLQNKAIRYTSCNDDTDFSDTQILIIDYIGELAYLYRYGTWAYVGGGFTPYLHSIIEATAYGLPVSFGPMIHRKVTPAEMIKFGIGSIVHNSEELNNWFKELKTNYIKLEQIKNTALEYAKASSGATKNIINELTKI